MFWVDSSDHHTTYNNEFHHGFKFNKLTRASSHQDLIDSQGNLAKMDSNTQSHATLLQELHQSWTLLEPKRMARERIDSPNIAADRDIQSSSLPGTHICAVRSSPPLDAFNVNSDHIHFDNRHNGSISASAENSQPQKSVTSTPLSSMPETLKTANSGVVKYSEAAMSSGGRKRGKPDISYIELISRAILSSPNGRLVLHDIYKKIIKLHPYFNTNDKSWRNSVRHNLSIHACFLKENSTENGKHNYWTIHPNCIEDFRNGNFNRRRARQRARVSTSDMDVFGRTASNYDASKYRNRFVADLGPRADGGMALGVAPANKFHSGMSSFNGSGSDSAGGSGVGTAYPCHDNRTVPCSALYSSGHFTDILACHPASENVACLQPCLAVNLFCKSFPPLPSPSPSSSSSSSSVSNFCLPTEPSPACPRAEVPCYPTSTSESVPHYVPVDPRHCAGSFYSIHPADHSSTIHGYYDGHPPAHPVTHVSSFKNSYGYPAEHSNYGYQAHDVTYHGASADSRNAFSQLVASTSSG